MSAFWQRIVTVVTGAALVVAGFAIPGAAVVLVPAGVGVLGWAVPHPADSQKKGL